MEYLLRAAASLMLLILTACQQVAPATRRAETPTPSQAQAQAPLVTLAEGASARLVAGQRVGIDITWLEPTGGGKGWQEAPGARTEVQGDIRAAQQSLASVDYAALSGSDFITSTRALKVGPADFTGQSLAVEAFGQGTKGERWTLYMWQGPEIPQMPERPLVHRWVQVYALYDMNAAKSTMLLATIRGEVHE